MNLYIDIGTRYISNMKTCSIYHWNQNRNKAENKFSLLQLRYLYICLFGYKALFVCVKDRTCLRVAIPAYCFSIFGSIFDALFCLLIKRFILGCDTIWKSMGKFLWAAWSVSTLPHMDKEETFLSWKLHIGMVGIFYTFSLDLKIWT